MLPLSTLPVKQYFRGLKKGRILFALGNEYRKRQITSQSHVRNYNTPRVINRKGQTGSIQLQHLLVIVIFCIGDYNRPSLRHLRATQLRFLLSYHSSPSSSRAQAAQPELPLVIGIRCTILVVWFKMHISLESFTAFLACLTVCHGLQASQIPSDTPLSSLITSAKTHLANGSPRDALLFYDAAVSRDPSNYLTIFQRGAAFLSLGKSSQALHDFDRVLELKPDFESALLQRARLKAKSADWASAINDLQKAGKQSSSEYQEILEAQSAAQLAQDAEKQGAWETCVKQANVAVVKAGTSLSLRRTRANCRFERGEVEEGISDLAHVVQISPGLVEPHLQMSAMLFYALGDSDRGVSQIRKCLHADPDSKPCNRLYRRERQLSKRLQKLLSTLSSRKYSNAANMLVGAGGDSGLLDDVKEDVEQAKEAGHIHPLAPNSLYASLVESTCEAYREVSERPPQVKLKSLGAH